MSDLDLKVVYPYSEHKESLLRRLRRIEGQVRGVQRMVEEGRYCVDVLTQVAAARAALQQVALALLESHTRGCVTNAVRSGEGDKAVNELMDVLKKLT